MSFTPSFGFPRFRETLKYEDHIHNQIEECRKAFNRGNALEIRYAVEGLTMLMTPNMADDEFMEDITAFDDAWKAERKKRDREFMAARNRASRGCPDIIEHPPKNPPTDHWRKAFMSCMALCERKGLMLKKETNDAI